MEEAPNWKKESPIPEANGTAFSGDRNRGRRNELLGP